MTNSAKERERTAIRALLQQFVERKIELRAHEIYEMRGKIDGHALDDWLQAESEVLRRSILTPLRKS